MSDGLRRQASAFAKETSDLLNKTVCDGVRISTLTAPDGRAIMGAGISRTQLTPSPIPVRPGAGRALVFLSLAHTYALDRHGVWLTMTSSSMSLYTSSEMRDEELVVAIDYVLEPPNEYPGAHLHVAGQREDLGRIYLGSERKTRELRDLHLPVGGRRFRPCLEDLIDFMVTERMVEPRPGWQDVVEAHRLLWYERQLKAAVRRWPDHAAEALRAQGWKVTPPAPLGTSR